MQQGLTQDDFDMYYEVWERYDEKASQYIPLAVVPDFLSALEEPLRLPPPNFYKMVALDIPICDGDRVHCAVFDHGQLACFSVSIPKFCSQSRSWFQGFGLVLGLALKGLISLKITARFIR